MGGHQITEYNVFMFFPGKSLFCKFVHSFSQILFRFEKVLNGVSNIISILECCCYRERNRCCVGELVKPYLHPYSHKNDHSTHWACTQKELLFMFVLNVASCLCYNDVLHHQVHHTCDGDLAAFWDCLLGCCSQDEWVVILHHSKV